MGIKRYIANKDSTITNAFNSTLVSRGTGSNMGASDILEVFSIYGQTSGSTGYSSEESRILINFSCLNIKLDRNKKTHKIISSKCFLYKKPNLKTKLNKKIYFNSKISILNQKNNFVQITLGWILKKNIKPINFKKKHFCDNFKVYLNSKYLWGGNSPEGLDCSALVQELLKFNNI